jgi:hypothetical protein
MNTHSTIKALNQLSRAISAGLALQQYLFGYVFMRYGRLLLCLGVE